MKSIILKNETFAIPESYKELTIYQYQQLNVVYTDTNIKSETDLHLYILTIILNKDLQFIKDLSIKELFDLNTNLQFIQTSKPSEKLVEKFELDGVEFHLIKDLNKLSVAEFTDLLKLCEANMIDNIHKIVAILYRPFKAKQNFISKLFKVPEHFEYSDYPIINIADRIQDSISFEIANSVLTFFFKWQLELFDRYEGLFNEESANVDLTIKQKEKLKRLTRWGWFATIMTLAKDDVTKVNDVLKQNIILTLNTLSYLKEKNI